MFFSLEEYKDGSTLEYDICIIGSGVASHAFLSKFINDNNNKRIAVLEGSIYSQNRINREISDKENISLEQGLYSGEISGWIKKNEPNYLLSSRLRTFGGTANIWSGWCLPLDRYDLEDNEIRRGFHWPIDFEELEYYYKQAQNFCFLPEYAYDNPSYWINKIKHCKTREMPLASSAFKTRMLYFNYTNLVDYHYPNIKESNRIHIFSNANSLSLKWRNSPGHLGVVDEITVCTIENQNPAKTITFKAKQFIIAAGALETTRILLLSKMDRVNHHIGKNFLEHPYLWVGTTFKLGDIPPDIKNFYFPSRPLSVSDRNSVIPILVPQQELLEKENIGNFRILLGGASHIPGTVNISWEQMPNLKNEITLSQNSFDLFGQSKIKINNTMSNTDKRTVKIIIEESTKLLNNLGYGYDFRGPNTQNNPEDWKDQWKIVPGNHPMGTTRMSDTDENGVVNSNCRLHNFDNLYIASSSVFPTGGYANSTFTIIALALRLGDYIRGYK
jgi:hypothetical protein